MGNHSLKFATTHLHVLFQPLKHSFFFGGRKDPDRLYGPPQTGHIARRELKRRLERDAELRESLEQQAREEKQRRHALRLVIITHIIK